MPKNKETQSIKAVIYARYSSDRQREESIEGQVRVCEDFARRNNMKIVHVYADRALSARSDRRPEFQMMIRDAGTSAFSVVLVYKLNRFARNRYDSAKYKHRLKKHGVKLVSAMENIADDPSGILLESVIEGMAEYYSAELSENVMRGMTENALEMKWPGGIVPLGYKLDKDHHLIIDEEKAAIVRKIFKMNLAGHTDAAIVKYLNEHHYVTAIGHPFNRSSLRSIYKNERYIGTWMWNTIRKPHAIPPIIDEQTFWAVHEKRKYRQKNKIRVCGGENYLLSGKLYCGQCGKNMVGTAGTSRNGTRYHYYTCRPHKESNSCPAKRIRTDKLEDLVVKTTTQILSRPDVIKAIAHQAAATQSNQTESLEIQSLQNEIADIRKKLENCLKAIDNGIFSDALTNHMHEYEKRLTELNDDLARQKILASAPNLTEKHIEFFFHSIAEQIKKADKYKSILLSSLIRCVIVYPDYIEIQYNYKKELPILQNPVKLSSSYLYTMVGDNGLEPLTSCL